MFDGGLDWDELADGLRADRINHRRRNYEEPIERAPKADGLSILDLETPPSNVDGLGHPFHTKQLEAWFDERPIICICAGWQSGKTVSLPWWLKREIQRCGPGDYGAFSSTFALLNKKLLPELRKVFSDVAEYRSGISQFIFTPAGSRAVHGPAWDGTPTVIQLGHAQRPDSLESATLKAVIWDECGQRLVPEQSFHTVQSRLMVNRGRMCLASKPYESGWFERLVLEGLADPDNEDVGVITYASWDSPANPPEDAPYWAKIKTKMPTWRFVMQYGGIFTMPAGLIYDCFEWEKNTCDDFPIFKAHPTATIHTGMDFGKINTGGVGVADDGDTLYVFGEYHAGKKRDYPDHIASMRDLQKPNALGKAYSVGCGGNKHGEDGWREAYRMHGLPLDEPPENNIDVQIQAVWSMMNRGKLKFFRNGAKQTIEDVKHYSRKVDADGNVLDEIDNDTIWHLLAALRYIVMKLRPNFLATGPMTVGGSRPAVEAMSVLISQMNRQSLVGGNPLNRPGSPIGR